MNTDIQDIYNILLGKHYWEKLFYSLGNLKKEGQEFTTNCPFCQSDRFSISTTKPVWKCWTCQESGDYLKYLQLTENKDFKEALLELANEAGIEVNISSNYQTNYQQKQRQLNLYETVQNFFLKSLVPNSPQHQYLRETRGYQSEIQLMDLCCQSWSEWVAEYLSQQFLIGTQLGNDGYINQCLEIEATISDGLERKLFTTKFLENLKSEGITETDLAQRRQEKLAKTSEGKAKMAITSLCQDLNKNLKEANFTQSELRIETGLNELKKARGIQLPAPYLADDLLLDISKTGEGLSTGYQDLDNVCLIPQGAITLVSARPSIGKTTFMLNLFLNQIQLYPEQAFYFFSYEESKSRLGVKLIQNLADKVISPQFNHSAYIHYFKTDREQKRFDEGIELGFQKYSELVNSGRLWLLDKRLNDADLVTIVNLLGESRHIGAVFIDYVQKIPCSNPGGQDWLNIKNVSQSILDCAVNLDIPIILGCQLNRATESRSNKKPSLGDLRQSGDLEQDANLVLGLYRDEFYNPQTVDTGILEVGILKNRNGKTGSDVKLSFIPETLKITNLSSKINNDFGF